MIKTLLLSTAIVGATLASAAAQEVNQQWTQTQLNILQQEIWNAEAQAQQNAMFPPGAPPSGQWVRVWVGTPDNPSPNVYYTGDIPGCRTNAARPDWGCY
jgi:hypothetical protein